MLPYLFFGSLQIDTYILFNVLALLAALSLNVSRFRQESALLSHWCQSIQRAPAAKKAAAVRCALYWSFFLTVIQLCSDLIGNRLLALLSGIGFGNYFGNVLLSPLLFAFICFVLRINPLRQLDLYVPSYAMELIFFKLACLLWGCCGGKPWEYGFYFVNRDRFEFPSQLLEMIVAIFLFLWLLLRQRKSTYAPGTMLPAYLILYSGTRFFTEFTREGETVLAGLQAYQLLCLLGFAVGLLELWLARKYAARFTEWFEHSFAAPRRGTQAHKK